jgi:hypothetical protein
VIFTALGRDIVPLAFSCHSNALVNSPKKEIQTTGRMLDRVRSKLLRRVQVIFLVSVQASRTSVTNLTPG